MQELIARAWSDPAFKRELLADPRAAIEAALGVTLPEEVRIHVHADTETDIHLVLPRPPR